VIGGANGHAWVAPTTLGCFAVSIQKSPHVASGEQQVSVAVNLDPPGKFRRFVLRAEHESGGARIVRST
jgi:hypothetical protein